MIAFALGLVVGVMITGAIVVVLYLRALLTEFEQDIA